MDPKEIDAINEERLGRWRKRLTEFHSTPLLILGVGHGAAEGRPIVFTLEDVDDQKLIQILQGVLGTLLKRN